ncbi:MAG: RNA ligase (ATP) [Candidatus Lokiarchaeota archaeon]|nr:RNA ligase (ATP) [Candidatus Lokiarchaeota archaeon]
MNVASDLIVPVVELKNIKPHPNADKLDICDVLGYQMVIPKGRHNEGDRCVYFPADTILPNQWADKFGVKNFLKGKNKDRVGRIALRGEPSFGLIAPVQEDSWEVGDNVADYFGCEKYEPPIRTTAGDAAPYDDQVDPFIQRYTDIQNGRIYTDVFEEDEEVIATEKLHGTNCKLIIIQDKGIYAGSMGLRRQRPLNHRGVLACVDDPEMKSNTYWYPWTIKSVINLMQDRSLIHKVVILYGEVYGGSVQSLSYGIPKGKGLGFRAFDLMVDGTYVDFYDFEKLCSAHNVPMVPVLYRGPWSMDKMKKLSDGKSTVEGADHIREGIVVRPIKERICQDIGRVILKYIGTEYELSKHKQKDTKDQ